MYKHITVGHHIRTLAPHPSHIATTHKVQVPALVREVFQVGYSINVFVASGRALSLWHCLEWVTDRRSALFDADRRSYSEKVADAEAYRERLHKRIRAILRSPSSHPYVKLAEQALKAAKPASDAYLMAVALTLQLHLVVVECFPTQRWRHYYASPSFEDNWPIVLLVRTENNWFHLTVINDEVRFSPNSATYHGLLRTATPDVAKSLINPKLAQRDCNALYYALTGTTPAHVRSAAMTKELLRYKVVELRSLCEQHGIALPSRILKADIVARLVEHLWSKE